MLKKLFFIVSAFILSIPALAYDALVNGIYYNFSGTEAIITNRGYDNSYSGSVVIPATVTYESITYNVTSIGSRAFYNCSDLTSITIPNSVIYISSDAFYGSGWYNNQPSGPVYAGKVLYKYKGSMPQNTNITIEDGTKAISESAFQNCSGLTSITIPNSITSIAKSTFSGCTGLTSITIPNSVTSIGDFAFSGCTSLTSISIPNSVISIGQLAFCRCSGLTSITIPNGVTSIEMGTFSECSNLASVTIPDGVTSIGVDAFYRCYKLSSINIPSTVTSIGSEAFWWCEALEEITLPNGITTIEPDVFRESGLNSIEIPSNVTYISSDAFNESWLTSVTIPNSVTGIGEKAFYKCDNMEDIYSYIQEPFAVNENVFPTNNGTTILHVPAGTKSAYLNTAGWSKFGESNIVEFGIGAEFVLEVSGLQMTFAIINDSDNPKVQVGHWDDEEEKAAVDPMATDGKSIVIPGQVTYNNKQYTVTAIDAHSFDGCSGLTSITIPNSVTSIGYESFEGCSALTSVIIPNSVTSISSEAFRACSSLTSVIIPNSVTSIGNEAFRSCSSLAEVTISNSVTSVASEIFRDCSALTSVTIPNSVTSIANGAFRGCSALASITIPNNVTNIGNDAFRGCKMSSITIPNSVTSIGSEAFRACSSLAEVTISNSVTSIASEIFRDCSALTSVTIPNSVTSIGFGAFRDCCALASITIPNNVTSIHNEAFDGCTGLETVIIQNENPLTITENTFSNRANATLYVPTGAKAAYEAADYWKDFKEIKETGTPSPNTINVETAGTLSSLISDEDKYNITDLTITGRLNGTDFRLLRAMAGNDYTGHPTEGKLEKLDLSGATIVAGGSYAEFEGGMCRLNNDGNIVSAYISEFIDNSLPECLFLGCSKLQEIKLPSSIVAIQTGAFQYTGLTSFVVPKSTETLKTHLFTGCDNLISLDVESGNTTYWAKDNAIIETSTNRLVAACKNTTIPSEVLIIGQNAFYNSGETIVLPSNLNKIERNAFSATSLKNIIIPASVSEIEGGAFASCDDLIGITVDAGNTTYESPEGSNAIIEKTTKTLVAGCQSTVIPSDVTAIGAGAFLNNINKNSISITLPASIKSIGSEAFYSCAGLASINLPTSITSIDENAFSYNRNLTVTVESTTPLNINENVFQDLSNSTLRVPAGSKSAYAAATGWKNFGTILEGNEGSTFTAETTEGWDMVFTILDETKKTCQVGYLDGSPDKTAVDKDAVNGPVTIPETVKGYTVVEIGKYAFYYVSDMASVTIPNTVTSIEEFAFSCCYGLTSFELPTSITNIGRYAFSGCVMQSSITIPNSVTSIGEFAFKGCLNLTSVTVEAETPLTITEGVFTNINEDAKLYVPAGSKAKYAAATGWKDFNEIIEMQTPSSNIVFASPEVKAACVAKWDTNSDGELSYAEAAAVTSLVDPKDFEDPFALLTDVESDFTFDEFQYFTGVTSLTNYDFDEFEHLTSIVLPNSIQSIEGGAFYDCKLTSIHIPASVTDISDTYINESVIEVLYTPAFSSSFLQTITVDPGNTRYSSPTGSNVIIDKTSNTLIMGCRNTDFSKIPNTVTTIAMRAFEGVEFANPAVNLPTSVEAIKAYAFNYSNIISINLGELTRLTEIGLTAFKDCDGLTEVTLPASITTMERAIFAGCDNIIKVVSNREEPLANNNNNFDPDHIIAIYNNAVLYVPSGKVEAYTNAGWEEPLDDDLKSFRVITDGDHTDPEAIEGLAYNGSDQKLILPGTYRTGMMEYSLDGSTYSTSIPTGKDAGSYTVYYRKVGLSDASILKVTIAAPKTISVFSGSNLWAGYVATENLAIPTGLEAYVITNLGATTATASSLNYIPQGEPVLLKRNNASVNDYEISTGTGTAPTVNLLKTYNSDKSVSNREGFILYNDEFVLVNEGTLPAGRVFLPANGSGRALTRTIVFDRDDIVDFGDSQENNDDSNQWYDIQGRKLERKPTKKGIYILDGRKVVIK